MSLHRLVALLSVTALVGLLGFAPRAEASNFSKPDSRKAVVAPKVSPKTNSTSELRKKIQDANIDGCGGEAHVPSSVSTHDAIW